MIYAQDNLFLLNGKNYSYAMCVNAMGLLQHLHFGGKITVADAALMAGVFHQKATPYLNNNADILMDALPWECSSYGKGDFGESTVMVRRSDGALMSKFLYHSHTVAEGAKQIDGMPCVRHADQTLTIVLQDAFSDTQIHLNYIVSQQSDVLVRNIEVHNVGKQTVVLERAYSFCVDTLGARNLRVMRLTGAWARERKPTVTPLEEGIVKVQSIRGFSSHSTNPFVALLEENCCENSGECHGYNLLYSGSFAMVVEPNLRGRLRVAGGVSETNFRWRLTAGQTFVTPQVAMCYSCAGLGQLSRNYADFFRNYIINPRYAFASRPIVANNWEATYFNFDNQRLFRIVDAAAQLGVDTFVLDDGWFGNRNNDASSLGDWQVNTQKLQGGLGPVIERCKQNGLKFGIWIEPEMISRDSNLFRAHPDWAIGKVGTPLSEERNQLVLDLSRKEVVDCVFQQISKLLSENDISYVKWDKNREVTENFSSALPPEQQGEFAHRCTLGFYNLAHRLTQAFPNVFFEGCAGGGGRFDGGALYYFPQIWTSDNTDAVDRTQIQWGTSICYPLSAASCHVSACPNHQTGRTTPFATRGAVASMGAFGYELDLSLLSDEEKQQAKQQIVQYRQREKLLLEGDLFRLSNPFESNHFCQIVVSKDKTSAYAAGVCFRHTANGKEQFLRIHGLAEDKTYFIAQLNVAATGMALKSIGLPLPNLPDFESFQWDFQQID